jgi:hypothetical protein
MILNSTSVELIRQNAMRLASSISSKDDLTDLATAGSYEHVLFAIETLLTNTEMYFDDELLSSLDNDTWKSFKALLMVYSLNIVNKNRSTKEFNTAYRTEGYREYMGASQT